MNKKDFKRYMKQGLGRCAQTLEKSKDIVKYKDIVLWGCLHNLSFDTQSEGTRAAYIYMLTSFYSDADYFVFPVVKAFETIKNNTGWLFSHYCELLQIFAESGRDEAQKALTKKYRELFAILINKRRFGRYDYERDNFEHICVALTSADNMSSFINIADDIGSLFLQNSHYDSFDFDWFFTNGESKYGKKKLNTVLRNASKNSDNIRCFYKCYLEFGQAIQKTIEKPRNAPSAEDITNEIVSTGKLSASLRIRFRRYAENREKLKLAQAVLQEQDSFKKAELLSLFTSPNDSIPIAHEEIVKYSKSAHERLSEVAFEVLTNCQSELVRQYAYELIKQKHHISDALLMVLNNYLPGDKTILLPELNKLRVDYSDESEWHAIGSKILDMYDRKVQLPKEFLIYIYNTTLCSCCREYAVRALAKHRWLTGEIIEECRYDSNYDISTYVNRYYPAK